VGDSVPLTVFSLLLWYRRASCEGLRALDFAVVGELGLGLLSLVEELKVHCCASAELLDGGQAVVAKEAQSVPGISFGESRDSSVLVDQPHFHFHGLVDDATWP
jgi:hypothetical protein